MKLTKRWKKDHLGKEDLELGKGHVSQYRDGRHFIGHKVGMVKELGLLNDAILSGAIKQLSDDITAIRFTGYYEEADGGEGIYVSTGTLYAEEDIGVIINSATTSYQRVYDFLSVNIKWFGAKGNGRDNDLVPFMKALAYPKILLQKEKYLLRADRTVEVTLYNALEIVGNDATLVLQAIQSDVMFRLTPRYAINHLILNYINIQGVGLDKVFDIQQQHLITFLNVSHFVSYSPEYLTPSYPEYVYTKKNNQVLTGKWTFESSPMSTINPTLDNHPIRQGYVTNLTQIDTTNYVTTNEDATITARKTYDSNPKTTLPASNNSAVNKGMLRAEIDKLVASGYFDELVTTQLRGLPPVGFVYLRFMTSGIVNEPNRPGKLPEELWPNTIWEKKSTAKKMIKVGDSHNVTYEEAMLDEGKNPYLQVFGNCIQLGVGDEYANFLLPRKIQGTYTGHFGSPFNPTDSAYNIYDDNKVTIARSDEFTHGSTQFVEVWVRVA